MDKTVFITGSTSGIGEACAYRFAEAGARLVLNGRNEFKLLKLKADIEGRFGVEVFPLVFDVRDRDAVCEAIGSLTDRWSGIDVLINNAGLVLGTEKEQETSPEDIDIMIDTNVKGLLYVTLQIVPGMVKRKSGHVINVGSIAGDAAYSGGSIYCASKAAVKALSDGLRIDLVDTPLRVTNIKPGLVDTNFSLTRFRGDKKSAAEVYRGLKPLCAADVAEVIFFASSVAEHVQIAEVLMTPTGQATANIVHRNIS
jgi:NADP-dependent 3-hydroxy acid dehydrogenase YdfG